MRTRRRTAPTAPTAIAALGLLTVLAGCRPNIPLIPGIKSDVQPLPTMTEITPPDRSPQASQARPHTARAAARRLP
jgi:hypothetical protein